MTLAELHVERVRWGFDGNPMCEAFNLLTIEVRNDGELPYAGSISLEHFFGMGRIGAPVVQSCSIAPMVAEWCSLPPSWMRLPAIGD